MRRPCELLNRRLNVLLAGAAMAAPTPVQPMIGYSLWRYFGTLILLQQVHPRHDGNLCAFVNFRTMLDVDGEKDQATGVATDEQRRTTLDVFFRSTDLEEFRAPWNFAKILLTHRLLLLLYLKRFVLEPGRRHGVDQAITGSLTHTNGHKAFAREDRLAMQWRSSATTTDPILGPRGLGISLQGATWR